MSLVKRRVECLDGLRGLAALWVLAGHCALLTMFELPVVSKPDLGVDLFILLSGFLMAYQYLLRKDREDWSSSRTWRSFWIRRFFRLSPLYFVLLVIALALGTYIYADRVFIDESLGRSLQLPERYLDFSITNVAMHVTYLFGLFPDYAYRTPLPDWSLGLEMQFYVAFPLLVVAGSRFGWGRMAMVALVVSIAVVIALRGLHVRYPMPSFLPLKLHLFLVGILVATCPGKAKNLLAVMALAALPIGPGTDLTHLVAREVIVIVFFSLIHFQDHAGVSRVARLLGSPVFFWLGELSYGCYLIHLLVLHPIARSVIGEYGVEQAPAVRFTMVFLGVMVLSYALAYCGYRWIEKPGQRMGKMLQDRIAGRS